MEKFGALNWSIIGLYLIANLSLGWYMSRRVKTSADYYIGDRSSPWWAIGISVLATYVSALSFLGGPAWAYGDGMAALAIHVNYALVIFLCIVFFIPFFYNSGVASIYEYLERRFGLASRAVMGLVFMLTAVIAAASILTATAFVVRFATGMSLEHAIIMMTVIVLLYTMMGGMNAVIWTDVLQGVILLGGAGIIMIALLGEIGSLPDALRFLEANGKLDPLNWSLDVSIAPTVWAGVFAMTAYHVTVYGANQYMVQRALAAKTIGDAKKSYFLMGHAAFILYFVFFFVGALLFVFYRGEPFEQPNEIILIFAETLAIPGLLGVIGAAILSASMSTTSSAFNSLATITVTDFYQMFWRKEASEKHYLLASRVFTVMWGLIVIPLAMAFAGTKGSILEVLSSVGSYFVGAKLSMFGLGFFSKHTTERGLLVGVAAGFIALTILVPLNAFAPLIDPLWEALNLTRPTIAWPWYVVIGAVFNIVVAWTASVLLDGFQSEWHEHSVPGQLAKWRAEGRELKQDGWYLVPGKVDPVVWSLPVMFILIMVFLGWFGTLG
ncbi:MAG: sodium/solute symporter [Pseudomonadota bacterium]